MSAIIKKGVLKSGIYTGLFGFAALLFLSACQGLPVKGALSAELEALMSRTDFKDYSSFQGSQDRSAMGWKLSGVYDPGVKEKIVIAGGYHKMGDTTFSGTWQGVSDEGTIETDAFEFSVAYRYPFSENFSAGGRIGAANVDVEEREVFGGVPESNSASETVPFGGLVMRYAFNESWGVSAHFDRYLDVGEVGVTGEGDIDVFGVAADFRFGGNDSDD